MINIQIIRYREPTQEEIKRQEDHERMNGYRNTGSNETDLLTPNGKGMLKKGY